MDSTDDLQPPCDCGALGDHPANPNCAHNPTVEIEVAGDRTACLQAIGLLRASYLIKIKHRWQDPETEKWVVKISATKAQPKPDTAPPPSTPEAAVMACLEEQAGLEVTQHLIYIATGIDDYTLTATLTALAAEGEIERIGPGVYRKNP